MGLKRWYYRGGRPNRVARVLDRCTSALYGLGIAPDYLVTLEVPGRRSGRIVTLPLVMAVVGGERYLVSMLGEKANWVCNVRAAGGEVTIRHGRREEVRLEEIAVDRRAPVLKAYLQRAPNARAHLPVHTDAPLAEFERVAHRFPVFRIMPPPSPSHLIGRERDCRSSVRAARWSRLSRAFRGSRSGIFPALPMKSYSSSAATTCRRRALKRSRYTPPTNERR